MKVVHTLILGFLVLLTTQLIAQQPFICDGRSYVTTDNKLNELVINWESDTFYLIPFQGDLPHPIDAIGYNPQDNFIYGIAAYEGNNLFYKIDATGTAFLLDTLEIDYSLWNRKIKGGTFTHNGQFVFSLASDVGIDEPNGIGILDLTPSLSYSITPATVYGYNPFVFIEDFAEHPINRLLWALQHYIDYEENPDSTFLQNFKNHHCFSTIDVNSFTVDNESYLPLESSVFTHGRVSVMFFDGFASLYGQTLTEAYRFDIPGNAVRRIKIDEIVPALDGCSCPYTLKMQQSVSPKFTYPCTEVVYTIKIANLTNNVYYNIPFKDNFPQGFKVTGVLRNPYGGTVSGLNSRELTITGMNITYGIDSLQLKVLLPKDSLGIFHSQAILTQIDLAGTNDTISRIFSDFPPTFEPNDPTPLRVIPFDLSLKGVEYEVCPDSNVTIYPLLLSEGLTFNWSTGSTDSILIADKPGVYYLGVSAGCNVDFAIFKIIQSDFQVDLGDEINLSFGDSILLDPYFDSDETVISYSWQSSEEGILSCLDCSRVFINPQNDGFVQLTATNSLGCTATDRVNIRVKKEVYIPNVFSPNFDGFNDFFYIQSKYPLKIEAFKVLNRWGALVFEKKDSYTNNPGEGWDGSFKNKPLENGIYAWYVEIVFSDKEKILFHGNVAIMR